MSLMSFCPNIVPHFNRFFQINGQNFGWVATLVTQVEFDAVGERCIENKKGTQKFASE
jgi:hypothetical protein